MRRKSVAKHKFLRKKYSIVMLINRVIIHVIDFHWLKNTTSQGLFFPGLHQMVEQKFNEDPNCRAKTYLCWDIYI